MERRDENNRQNRECKKEETRPRLRQREKMKKEEALRQAKKGKFHGEGEKFALLTFLAALLNTWVIPNFFARIPFIVIKP